MIRRLSGLVALTLVLTGLTGAARAADRPCGTVTAGGAGFVAIVVDGSVGCDEASYVVEFVLTHPPSSMGAPGRSPAGWTCGWGYLSADGRFLGRSGPSCSAPRGAVPGSRGYRHVDGRPIAPSVITDPWPYPLVRPVASPEAQAFMPLLFLDDDEHWPLSNPDWFLHTAPVLHCPRGTDYVDCRRVSPESVLDQSLRFLTFDAEQGRDGAPAAMFVNQTEPGQPAVPGGPPVSTAYRFFDYWWYYSYNRGPYGFSRPVAGNFDHLSDWEGATVAVRPDQPDRFDFVALSAHEAAWNYLPGVLRCGDGLQGDDRHEATCVGGRRVNVYAAEGTHAELPASLWAERSRVEPRAQGDLCTDWTAGGRSGRVREPPGGPVQR